MFIKRTRVIAIVICTVTLLCALALTANAKWWDDNPFTDVKSTHWYYDAVRIANENGLVKGMSDTKFSPSVKMTRAMLVQVLYNAEGIESEFTGTPFTDVKAKHWYAKAVQWAYENEITSGLSETKFGASAEIKREELAAMLYRYAEYKGMAIENSVSIEEFPDASKVSSWAVKNFEWAYGNSIISGSKKSDGVYLNPRNSATRAECAQMLSKYLYLTPTYEINGNDLSKYNIVYSANEIDTVEEAAQYLASHINASIGIELPVVTDEAEVSEYEILVGKTNREDKGLVTVDRGAFATDQVFTVEAQGNYLVISGIDSDKDAGREAKSINGSYTAVHYLLEEKFGVEFYTSDNTDEGYEDLIKYKPDPVISFDDGYFYSDEPFFDYRIFYMSGGILGASNTKSKLSQNISNYLTGNFGSYEDNYNATPCLTSEENKTTIINNILYCVETYTDVDSLCLNINDSSQFCKCDTCSQMYKKYGTRGATIIALANEVAQILGERYPGFEVQFGAYTYSAKPPIGMVLEDNITVEYITIEGCASHAYNDPTCKQNAAMMEEMMGWVELTDGKIHFWDHSGAFINFMTPFPDWDSVLTNVQIFADNSFEESGILMNSVFGGQHPDFGDIRAYMFSLMYRDPYMSEEEFDYHLAKGLEAYYGAGWKELRTYLDKITLLGNDKCHVFHAGTSGWYDYDKVAACADELDALWEKAAAQADEKQLERLTLARQSWIYLRQCATHTAKYVNGTDADKAEYVAANEALYKYVTENDVIWTEAVHGSLADCDMTKGPDKWQIGG